MTSVDNKSSNIDILVKIMTISLKIITIFAKNDDILVKMTV